MVRMFPLVSMIMSPILGYIGYWIEKNGQFSYALMVLLCMLSSLLYLKQGGKNVLILNALFFYLLLLRIIFSALVGGSLENLNWQEGALLVLLALVPFVAVLVYISPSIVDAIKNKF